MELEFTERLPSAACSPLSLRVHLSSFLPTQHFFKKAVYEMPAYENSPGDWAVRTNTATISDQFPLVVAQGPSTVSVSAAFFHKQHARRCIFFPSACLKSVSARFGNRLRRKEQAALKSPFLEGQTCEIHESCAASRPANPPSSTCPRILHDPINV